MSNVKPDWLYEEYSHWARTIAANYTKAEIEREINKCDSARSALGRSHFNAVNKTTSMTSNSQRRAQSGNAFRGNWEKMQAHIRALEIYEFYPEKTKEGAR